MTKRRCGTCFKRKRLKRFYERSPGVYYRDCKRCMKKAIKARRAKEGGFVERRCAKCGRQLRKRRNKEVIDLPQVQQELCYICGDWGHLHSLGKWRESGKRNLRKLVKYLIKHPCMDCGEPDPEVLQFDHVLGKKKFHILERIWSTTC